MIPVPLQSVVFQIGAKGYLSLITPFSESTTSTLSTESYLTFHSDSFMRSKEYLTSSAVTSPKPFDHLSPGRSENLMLRSSAYSIEVT